MFAVPTRAPIPYDDIRRPYNTIRAAGALLFIVGVLSWSLSADGERITLIAILPAGMVFLDALRRRSRGSNALATEIIGVTAIGLALVLRGPSDGIHGLAIVWVLVSTSLILPLRQAAALVMYMVAWSVTTSVLYVSTDLTFVGIIEGSRAEAGIDRITAIAFVVTTTVVMLGAARAVLRSQDKHAEALAQERRAVELKNEFVSMVSHELRTPLTGLAGFTETLADSWSVLPPEEVDEFLRIMLRENEHLSSLVEDILVIPRLEAGQIRMHTEDFDLATDVHTVASLIFGTGAYSVAIPANIVVRADRTRLRQILRNLLENAKKYGGDEVLIEGELSGSTLYTVVVSDNGSGIMEEDQERIFQQFEQLSSGSARLQQGVGLGLPIARKLAKAMGGDLWYEDRFPVGSRFCFSVTVVDDEDTPEAEIAEHTHT